MAFKLVIATAVLALFAHGSSAQMFGNFRPGFGMMGGQPMQGMQQESFRTCIGQTAAGDELRVTFSETAAPQSFPVTNWFPGNNDRLKVEADITSGSISGMFQLVVTEFGRIDGVCESGSLGEILNNQPNGLSMFGFMNQRSTSSIGAVGTQFELSPGKSVSLTDNINTGLTMDLISGSGMALCPVQQIVGNRCIDVISLCCSIAKDTKPATQPIQQFAQGGMVGRMPMDNMQMGGMNMGPMQNNMGNMQNNMRDMQMSQMGNGPMNRGLNARQNGGFGAPF